MKPLTREWVKKAEGDFQTAQREDAQENRQTSIAPRFTLSNASKNILRHASRKQA